MSDVDHASARRIRVLLCDDHDGVRNALRTLVEADRALEVVGEAADGATLLRRAGELVADVILLDVSLPDMSGLQVAADLRNAGVAAKIIALSAHEDQAYIDRMRAVGAAGYVVKRLAGDTLIRTIRDVAGSQRETVSPSPAAGPATGASNCGDCPLRGLESAILQLLAVGRTGKQIAATLGLSPAEVDAHRSSAMHTLGLQSRADVVRYARRRGWLDNNDDPERGSP